MHNFLYLIKYRLSFKFSATSWQLVLYWVSYSTPFVTITISAYSCMLWYSLMFIDAEVLSFVFVLSTLHYMPSVHSVLPINRTDLKNQQERFLIHHFHMLMTVCSITFAILISLSECVQFCIKIPSNTFLNRYCWSFFVVVNRWAV